MITLLVVAIAVCGPLLRVRRGLASLVACGMSVVVGSAAWWGSGLLGWPRFGWEWGLLLVPLCVAAGLMGEHYRRVWRQARQQFREVRED